MPTTVHALCLDLAAKTTSRVERYLLLRMAQREEVRTARVEVLGGVLTPEALSIILAPFLGRLADRIFGRATTVYVATSPASAPN